MYQGNTKHHLCFLLRLPSLQGNCQLGFNAMVTSIMLLWKARCVVLTLGWWSPCGGGGEVLVLDLNAQEAYELTKDYIHILVYIILGANINLTFLF